MRIHAFWDCGACGMIRLLMPLDAMRDLGGHQVTTSYGWGPGKEMALAAEVVIGQRFDKTEALPVWRRLRPGRRLVYEIDDDLWHIDPTNLNALRLREAAPQDAVQACIEVADLVTVTTPTLADRVRQFNPNVVVLPNCIEGRMLAIERPRRDRLVVGWAGGSSHVPDLAIIHKVLQRFLRQHPEAEFHNVGTDFRRLLGVNGRYSTWRPYLFDYYGLIDFDVALAPLARTEFNRSKSGIKALEAMALGIPVIASDMEPYREVVEHGVTGFLCRQEHEWMRYLRLLAGDRDLRERMGAAGRRAARRWTIEGNWRLWEQAYAGLLARRAVPA